MNKDAYIQFFFFNFELKNIRGGDNSQKTLIWQSTKKKNWRVRLWLNGLGEECCEGGTHWDTHGSDRSRHPPTQIIIETHQHGGACILISAQNEKDVQQWSWQSDDHVIMGLERSLHFDEKTTLGIYFFLNQIDLCSYVIMYVILVVKTVVTR